MTSRRKASALPARPASAPSRPALYFVSLGCPKNQVDSERALHGLDHQGFRRVSEPHEAEVIVVNTCAFIQSAEKEAVQALLEAASMKRKGKARILIASGCLVAKHGEAKLKHLIPEIDAATLPADPAAVLAAVRSQLGPRRALAPRSLTLGRSLLSSPGSAYLKIAEGCSRRCSFCLIPQLRGPMRSRPIMELMTEARMLAAQGVKELVVVAQDTSRYGQDLPGRPGLGQLLDQLVTLPQLTWIRVMYINPDGLTEALLDRFVAHPQLCRYLDLPVQHADPNLLKRMRRAGTAERTLRLIARIRDRLPGVAIRTSLISGFPGESEAAHETLMRFVQAAEFDRLGVFTYSREPGTEAAELGQQVPARTAERRRKALMDLQAVISRRRLAQRVGMTLTCLVEESSGVGHVIARTPQDAPEVDGAIVLTGTAKPGDLVQALVTGSTDHDLNGVIL